MVNDYRTAERTGQMKKTDRNKIIKIVEQQQTAMDDIERICKGLQTKLDAMVSRNKTLGDKGNILERRITNLDIARVELLAVIEDLTRAIEP